jgi:gentisate 1,2-dioxygenase
MDPVALGRFLPRGHGFNVHLAPVPAGRATAPASNASLGWHVIDRAGVLESPVPATTPFLLARYGVLAPGSPLPDTAPARSRVVFILDGRGHSASPRGAVSWSAGDVLALSGHDPWVHRAEVPSRLWTVDDGPLLAGLGVVPDPGEPARPVRFVAEALAAALATRREEAIRQDLGSDGRLPAVRSRGRALTLGSADREAERTLLPTLSVHLNTVEPGEAQAPHRHAAAAIGLVLSGEGCWSEVDGARLAWSRHDTLITPSFALHAHGNDGEATGCVLLVQDGPLHYLGRTMRFESVPAQEESR